MTCNDAVIACHSVYCPSARARLTSIVPAASGGAMHVDGPFLALVAAVAKLEAHAARWLEKHAARGMHLEAAVVPLD